MPILIFRFLGSIGLTVYGSSYECDFIRDVPVIHPVPGKCWISHYSILPGPGEIMRPSNKRNFVYFLIFIKKKLYGIVDKNILCRIKNIQSYKLVFCVQYFLIFTVSCS